MIKRITAEKVNANRKKWFVTLSIDTAKRFSKASGNLQIYRLPNGAYAIRKGKNSPETA